VGYYQITKIYLIAYWLINQLAELKVPSEAVVRPQINTSPSLITVGLIQMM